MDRITSVIWGSLLAWNLLDVNLCAQTPPTDDGSNLRLEITNANNGRIVGVIRNSSSQLPYAIFSKQSLLWPAWIPEATVYGAEASTNTPFNTSQLGRDTLFLQVWARLAPRTVSAGSMHFAVIKRDGLVWTWGVNEDGELGNGTWDGSLIPTQAIGLSNIVAVVAPESSYYNLALDSNGVVWSWGLGEDGELGRADGRYEDANLAAPVPGLSNVVAIAGGWAHSVALKSDGTVWTWGDNWGGQLGNGTTIERDYAAPVPGLTNAITIASGGDHSLALCADGTVWAWGYNLNGQLGIGNDANRLLPAAVIALTNAIALSCGGNHSLALLSDGTLAAWGKNSRGQLGNGTFDDALTPTPIPGLSNIVAVAGGDDHSLALDSHGAVFLWGNGFWGQLGNGIGSSIPTPFLLSNVSNAVAIAAGQYSSIASTVDGKIYVWGLYGCLNECDMHKRAAPAAYELENLLDTDGDGLPDWFETAIGGDTNNPDSDYDGRTDLQEVMDGTDPLDPEKARQVLLGSWQFEAADWKGDQGQSPMAASNILWVPDWNGHGLRVTTNFPARLNYHEADGTGSNLRFNLNLRRGSISFWYRPDWSSAGAGGSGPGMESALVGCGSLSSDFWGMAIDADGSQLDFRCVADGQAHTFLSAPVSFASNQWVQIDLTYSTNSSALYINGQLLQTGDGVSEYPKAGFRETHGFNIGSSYSGENPASGDFDKLATYNYPRVAAEVYSNYYRDVFLFPLNIQLPTLLVNSNQITLDFSGVPLVTVAILTNGADFSSATWNTYSGDTNISILVDLPSGDGTYTFTIGYRVGEETKSITRTVTVDKTPPVIWPASQVVTTTTGLLQLAGTSSEPLADIQFDVINIARTNLNQIGYVMGAQLDSTSGKETTNQFQCFDILLAPGDNLVTVRARDFAGNTATNTYQYVLDVTSRSTPPVITVQWPQNGAKISGTNFTICGQLDDPATKINLTTVISGATNTIPGSVGRDGRFWVPHVPPPEGLGQFTLTAEDIAGNTASVVKTVSSSAISLTIDSIGPANSTPPVAAVSGRVNAVDCSVSVNGTEAVVSPDGDGSCTWTANVSVPAEGSFPIKASATHSGGDVPDAETMQMVDNAGGIQVFSYNEQMNAQVFSQMILQFYAFQCKDARFWTNGLGGSVQAYQVYQTTNAVPPPSGALAVANLGFNWTDSWPPSATDISVLGDADFFDFNYFYAIPLEHCEEWGVGPLCSDLPTDDISSHTCNFSCRKADTRMKLIVGGKGLLGQSQLVMLSASATANDGEQGPIPADNIAINGRRLVASANGSGISFQRFPTGTNVDVTPHVANYDTHSYSFSVTATSVNFQLAVDNNRDGNITFDGEDRTGPDNPYRFWVNNDNDGYDNVIEEYADLDPSGGNDANNLTISCKRELEDYTRLWIDTKDIVQDLRSGKLLLALEWKDAIDDPRMQFFLSEDTNGSLLYLTDADVAAQQVNTGGTHIIEWAHRNILTKYNPFIFPPGFWAAANVSAEQPVAHLLFDAVSRGSGQLVLSIYRNDGETKLAESEPIYLKLQDVKEMYERWTVDDNAPVVVIPSLITTPYSYDPTIPAENNYILFVHGWNLAPWERDAFADTAFKRLYWQGYKGHFGAFQWPTLYGFGSWKTVVTDPDHFDNSELIAWNSGIVLENLLAGLNSTYPGQVYVFAHSMGNVVVGEALKLSGTNQVVNTYIAMQAAVPAHCYDQTADFRTIPLLYESGTPDRYANYPANNGPCYFDSIAGAGTFINFYNPNDWALNSVHWQLDQDFKPDSGYSWDGTDFLHAVSPLHFPMHTYEIFSYCDEARCYALGAQANVNGAFNERQIDLGELWPLDDSTDDPTKKYGAHKWHSAEFNFDNMQQATVWNTLLGRQGFNLR